MRAADEHRVVAEAFTRRVRGVGGDAWDAPAPVEGWVARDVVRHLLEWLPGFLESGAGLTLSPGPSVDDDPVGAWEARCGEVQAVLEDPATSGATFHSRQMGDMALDRAIDDFYTPDVFLHTWDLARATGQDEHLDADRCARILERMAPFDELMRSSGQFGPKVEVPADADVQTRLLGFIGRDSRRR